MTDEELKERARGFLRRYADSPQVCLYCNVIHAANCPKEDAVINSMAAFASSIQEEARQQITSLNAEVAEFRADCIRLNGQLAEARAQGMREAAEIARDPNYEEHYPDLWNKFMKDQINEEEMIAAAIERAAHTPPASQDVIAQVSAEECERRITEAQKEQNAAWIVACLKFLKPSRVMIPKGHDLSPEEILQMFLPEPEPRAGRDLEGK